MIVYSVSVQVVPGSEDDFKKATKLNHRETRKELGNLRFDVLQSAKDPGRFLLYEVYRSEEAVKAHKETRHYKIWRQTVAPWMARDREGEEYHVVSPISEEDW